MSVLVPPGPLPNSLVLAVVVVLDLSHNFVENLEEVLVGEFAEGCRPLVSVEPGASVIDDGFEEVVLLLQKVG